jgi:hypothetical protein
MGNGKGDSNEIRKKLYMCIIKGVWESVKLGPHICMKG